jgi:integrase
MTLTVKKIEAARPQDRPYKLADAEGLYLFVSVAGGKSWRCNYSASGKQATKTYGRYPELSLAEARRMHSEFRASSHKKNNRTFEEVATDWLKLKLPKLSNSKHQRQIQQTLEQYAYPHIGDMPIHTIKRADLVYVVREIEALGIIETAHRVAGRIGMVFDYAQDIGLLEHHVASGLTRIIAAKKRKKPMASIPPNEAAALLRAIETYDEPVTRLGLFLLAHTFVRVGELRGMKWAEIKQTDAVWVIPESRMKLRKPHVVPLSQSALRLLDELAIHTGQSKFVFESPLRPGHPISDNTFLFALYRLGYRGRMTAHGFRALASTVLNEQSGFTHDVIERQLAHKETDAVRAAYNRAEYLPQRRKLMIWWSEWLEAQKFAEDH